MADTRAVFYGLVGKPMPRTDQPDKPGSPTILTNGLGCDTIDGMREVPISSLAPGRRFELVLTATSKPPYERLRGLLVRKGPGTVAVALEASGKLRTFTTAEGDKVTLRPTPDIVYWSPGTPVLPLFKRDGKTPDTGDITRWTTRGGTGVGPDMHHPANFQALDERRIEGDNDMAKTAPVPGTKASTKAKAGKSGKTKARDKAPKELHPCLCGCGERVAGRFRQGHDGRYYSILKKVAAGEMQFQEMSKTMQAALQSVAGVKKALAASKH